ncbi:MAG: PAC2 family protein [Promethearchaeota archaeon]|nr:MAG: PAC2 family protein [Candidatus Lokiarchaeota archaeon]
MNIYFNKKFDVDKDSLHDPIVLIGWPGIALVGKLAISSIADSIGAEIFMEIEFFDLPAKSKVEDGNLSVPSATLYYKSREGKNDLFILTGDYQPQSPEGVFEFSMKFCEKMKEVTGGAIQMYISTGAMVSDKNSGHEQPMVYVCGTHDEHLKQFLDYDNTQLMESGVIAGANGILPAWAGNKGFAPGVCLLAETLPLPMMNLDPKASKALVSLLKDHFDIDMTYDELDKKIEEMEEALESFKNKANHIMRGERPDKGPESYFR